MDAQTWNERYDTPELIWSGSPNQFLPQQVEGLEVGTVLDLACGEGRNAVWLGTQGWEITGVDFSEVGIAKAKKLAADNDITGTWVTADATTWSPPLDGFDLVLVFYLQLPATERRAAVKTAISSLAIDGTFVLVAHDLLNLTQGFGGPQDANVLVTSEGIIADITAAEIDLDVELVIERAERIDRAVSTPDGDRNAIDTLVRVHRVA